jgi:hypothetical protein
MKPYIHTEKTDPSAPDSYYALMADISYYAGRVACYAAKCEALAFEPSLILDNSGECYSSRRSAERMLQLNIERVNKCLTALLALETASVQVEPVSEAAE